MSATPDLFRQADEAIRRSQSLLDHDYPRFHLAPPVGRLNDPNGLVIIDGTYHAFYQYGPFFPTRRLVYWGHATSTDLLHWRHHRPALAPDQWYDRSGVYSGGALVHDGTVWFHYTGNVKNSDGSRESYQCLATTTDSICLTKHETNPLISGQPSGYTTHFRDPQVWRAGDGSFRMCLGSQRQDETGCALLYRSSDLLTWIFEGELSFPDSNERFTNFGYMWECPNLLRMTDETTGQARDVLLFCPQGLGFDDGLGHNQFPCGYVVGQLEGTRFHNASEFIELDRGFEFYAPQTFSRVSGDAGPHILLGWLGNPAEDDQPSLSGHGWVHCLSVARELTLRDGRIYQRPLLGAGTPTPLVVAGTTLRDATAKIDEVSGVDSFALHLTVELADAATCTVRLGTSEKSEITFTVSQDTLIVDRSATRYPNPHRRTVQLAKRSRIELHLVHDRSITEAFVNGGAESFSMRSYLDDGCFGVSLASAGEVSIATAELVLMD